MTNSQRLHMVNNKSVSHHTLADFLVKKFGDKKGYIWIGDKCHKEAYKTQSTKIFAVDNINSTYDLSQLADTDGENFHEKMEQLRSNRSDKYEKVLEKIDTRAARPISDIIEMARSNCRPQLIPERKDRVMEFLLAQERRTPESQEQIFSTVDHDEVVNDVMEATLRDGGFDLSRDWLNRSPVILELKQVMRENRIANFAAADHPILQHRTTEFLQENWGIVALVIRLPRRNFIIGSRGLTTIESGPLRGTWLPVAPDVAIALTPFHPNGMLLCPNREKERVIKAFNESTAAQSRIIAGQSKELVESLRRDYWRRGFHPQVTAPNRLTLPPVPESRNTSAC